jgi:hypothetical protein
MFGTKADVDPVRRLIGSASAWGGNPSKDATYLTVTPPKNDGKTAYKLTVKDVPVDGFWSVSLYNAEGYFQPNDLNAYSLNSITAQKAPDGTVNIQLFPRHQRTFQEAHRLVARCAGPWFCIGGELQAFVVVGADGANGDDGRRVFDQQVAQQGKKRLRFVLRLAGRWT